jgi:hypothetical protein
MSSDDPTILRRPIPGFSKYAASEDGSIWSYRHSYRYKNRRWKQLKANPQEGGYLRVFLRDHGTTSTVYVHRLILLTFVGPCPEGMEVCHIDGNRSNNRLSNLRYDTRTGNHSDKRNHGTQPMGSRVWIAKLTEVDVVEARRQHRRGAATTAELAERYHVTTSVMYKAIRGDTWKHIDITR